MTGALAGSFRTLLCGIATTHCTLGTVLGIAEVVLVVAFSSFEMILGRFLMVICSLFMETASVFGILHDMFLG